MARDSDGAISDRPAAMPNAKKTPRDIRAAF
jgi:hypothetical protein